MTNAEARFNKSHIRKVYACLAVTCHLHFWQNDRYLLRATVVTRGWNGYRNKSQNRKSTLENKILPRSSRDSNPRPFNHESGALTTELSRPPRWSRPITLFLSVPHWRVTLNPLLIRFDCLICRRTSPVCVVSVTTRGGVWRWTQPS